MQVPISFKSHKLRIKESTQITVMLEEETKEMLVFDTTETEQLKLVPVKMRNQSIGGDKIEDFALMKSNEILCVTSSGSVKKVLVEREIDGLKMQQVGVVDYICRYCGELQKNSSHCIKHIYRCHRGPVNCKYCNFEYTDRHTVLKHEKNCMYLCNINECMWPGTRLLKNFKRHMKKHGVIIL